MPCSNQVVRRFCGARCYKFAILPGVGRSGSHYRHPAARPAIGARWIAGIMLQ
jgi:hypothetical protein